MEVESCLTKILKQVTCSSHSLSDALIFKIIELYCLNDVYFTVWKEKKKEKGVTYLANIYPKKIANFSIWLMFVTIMLFLSWVFFFMVSVLFFPSLWWCSIADPRIYRKRKGRGDCSTRSIHQQWEKKSRKRTTKTTTTTTSIHINVCVLSLLLMLASNDTKKRYPSVVDTINDFLQQGSNVR